MRNDLDGAHPQGPLPPNLPLKENEDIVRAVHNAALLLPDEEKADYVAAYNSVRALVLLESSPVRYYELENGNAEAAAERLTSFWRFRKRLFGDRAHLPMDLTGEGAMGKDEIELLKTGYLQLLPKDRHGRNVLFYHNSMEHPLLQGPGANLSKTRCNFYILALASRERVPLVALRYSENFVWHRSRSIQVYNTMRSMPLYLEAFIALFVPPSGARRAFEREMVPIIFEDFFKTKWFSRFRYHVGDPINYLQQFGIVKQHLPTFAGGLWSHQDFLSWMESLKVSPSEDDCKPPAVKKLKQSTDGVHRIRVEMPQERIDEGSKDFLSSTVFSATSRWLQEPMPKAELASDMMSLLLMKQDKLPNVGSACYPVLGMSTSDSGSTEYIRESIAKLQDRKNTPLRILASRRTGTVSDDVVDAVTSVTLRGYTIPEEARTRCDSPKSQRLVSDIDSLLNGEDQKPGGRNFQEIHSLMRLEEIEPGSRKRPTLADDLGDLLDATAFEVDDDEEL